MEYEVGMWIAPFQLSENSTGIRRKSRARSRNLQHLICTSSVKYCCAD